MAKSKVATALDDVQKPLTALLKTLGFKRKGRTYNRLVGDGLIHTVNLQMGQYPIGDYVIPGIRESLYGRFTVNLGVFLPAVPQLEHGRDPPAFVQEYHCEIRNRLGTLVFGEDTWWDLDCQIQTTKDSIVNLMDRYGLPFLDEFEDYSSVLARVERTGVFPGSHEGRSALAGALICHHLGQRERAELFFDRAIESAKTHEGFRSHIMALRTEYLGK